MPIQMCEIDGSNTLAVIDQLCEERGLRLTLMRRTTLAILLRATQPLSAYALKPLLEAVLNRSVKPVSIYRALDFLVREHFAARIESRSGYVACVHPERPHTSVFFVCDHCRGSEEIENPSLQSLIDADATHLGFKVIRPVVELQGLCAACQTADTGPARPVPPAGPIARAPPGRPGFTKAHTKPVEHLAAAD